MIIRDEQLGSIAEQIRGCFALYQATKQTENSHDPFAQMVLNMGWGMVMAVVTLFGPEIAGLVKTRVEAAGVAYPSEGNDAIQRILRGQIDPAQVVGLEIPETAPRRCSVRYRSSSGDEGTVAGLLMGKTMHENQVALVVQADDGTSYVIPLSTIIGFSFDGETS